MTRKPRESRLDLEEDFNGCSSAYDSVTVGKKILDIKFLVDRSLEACLLKLLEVNVGFYPTTRNNVGVQSATVANRQVAQ